MSSGTPVIDRPMSSPDLASFVESVASWSLSPSSAGAMWPLGYQLTGAEIRLSGIDTPDMYTPPMLATAITAWTGRTFRTVQSYLSKFYTALDTTITNSQISLPGGTNTPARISTSELSATMLTLAERFLSITSSTNPPTTGEAGHAASSRWGSQAALSFNPATSPAAIAASRLRQLSGLDATTLGAIFGVTRTTYQNWLAGASSPRGPRRRRLMETTALLEETAARFGNAQLVAAWLVTPGSVSEQRPIEYLRGEKYTLYRGALLRAPGGERRVYPIRPARHIGRKLSPAELEDALQRLGPRAWQEEAADGTVRNQPRSDLARRHR